MAAYNYNYTILTVYYKIVNTQHIVSYSQKVVKFNLSILRYKRRFLGGATKTYVYNLSESPDYERYKKVYMLLYRI